MSNKHVYQLIDETDETHYLVGVFDSIASAEQYLNTIKEPVDDNDGSEYQKLILREIELNKVQWSMIGWPILKLEIEEKLLPEADGDEEADWFWEVTKWQRKPGGRWELIKLKTYKK